MIPRSALLPGYRTDGPVLGRIVYHMVLVTRRRRAFFADTALAARAEELIRHAAGDAGCHVRGCTVHPSWVVLEVEAPAGVAPSRLATVIARGAGGALKAESEAVRRSGAAFVHRYLVSTEAVPERDCAAFVARVPTR